MTDLVKWWGNAPALDDSKYGLDNGKVYDKNGNVAVLFSPGFGAGYTTWNSEHELSPFQPQVVMCVLAGKLDLITEENLRVWMEIPVDNDDFHVYLGGVRDLTIEWVPAGSIFEIDEYDGFEGIRFFNADSKGIYLA
jgi:hypothetical protein